MFCAYVRCSQGPRTDPAKDIMPRACRRILGYTTIIECNGEARRQPTKNGGTLRRLIAYRLNVEIHLERHILFTRFRECNWAVHFGIHGLPKLIDIGLGSCASCPGLWQDLSGCPNERSRRLNIKCQHVSRPLPVKLEGGCNTRSTSLTPWRFPCHAQEKGSNLKNTGSQHCSWVVCLGKFSRGNRQG